MAIGHALWYGDGLAAKEAEIFRFLVFLAALAIGDRRPERTQFYGLRQI